MKRKLLITLITVVAPVLFALVFGLMPAIIEIISGGDFWYYWWNGFWMKHKKEE